MMRSNSITKTAKPPPPIPPRPSKAVVAEALAKTRKIPNGSTSHEEARQFVGGGVSKSQSYSNVIFSTQKMVVAKIARSPSQNEGSRASSRPVVFQSSNMRPSKVETGHKSVKTASPESSPNKHPRDRADKAQEEVTVLEENTSPQFILESKNDRSANRVVEKKSTTVENNHHQQWNDVLNGKNHVNTLIDEMFASILESADDKIDDYATESETVLNGQHKLEGVDLVPDLVDKKCNQPKMDLLAENCGGGNAAPDIIADNLTISGETSESEQEICSSRTTTVLVIEDETSSRTRSSTFSSSSNGGNATDSSSPRTKPRSVKFDDKRNHELLISELQNMSQKRQEQQNHQHQRRRLSEDGGIYDEITGCISSGEGSPKIQRSDWVEVDNGGKEVRLSSCQIIIEDGLGNGNVGTSESAKDSGGPVVASRLNGGGGGMSSLHGLPPLPKSLSGFSLFESQRNLATSRTPTRAGSGTPSTPGTLSSGPAGTPYGSRTSAFNGASPEPGSGSNLDNQLAILRREMYSLRQLDLSLLSQLWSLNESIQDFRQILQDQDDRPLSPPSPSPSPSSCDDGEADEFFSPSPIRLMRPAPPPPPLRRTSNSSSANSSEYGTV